MSHTLASAAAFYGLLVREQQRQYHHQQAVHLHAAQSVARWMPLPLTSVHVSASVFDFCGEVTVTQTYRNASPLVLESEFIFPLDDSSAVCGFQAELNGRVIHGIVKEKAEARKEFNRAKAAGKSTMLLEQHAANVFRISIGNLDVGCECRITLTYITTLDLEGKANRVVIPAVVAPKYEPRAYFGYDGHWHSGGGGQHGFNGPASVSVVAPSASSGVGSLGFFHAMTTQYMQQPHRVAVVVPDAPQPTPVPTVAFKGIRTEPQRFSMSLELLMPSEIVSIVSESHPDQIRVAIDPLAGDASQANAEGRLAVPHHAKVTFGLDADGSAPSVYPESLGSRDFVLTISQRVYLETRAVLEVDPATGSQAVQLAFCPQTLDLMDASALQTEIVFLIDQSGSMGGSAIEGVRAALGTFLRSLPVACRFNLVSFGSTYRKLFSSAKPYSDATIQQALAYASSLQADLGGTEILAPLKACFEASRDPAYPRQIFLLTDGQVTNTQELIDLTRAHSTHTRLFTFGLGSSVDRHLVKQLAASGRGECEFIAGGSAQDARQDMNAKVMRNLIRAMQPSLTDVKVDWSAVKSPAQQASSSVGFLANLFGGGKVPSIQQCPEVLTPIFPPNRELIYALGAQAALPPSNAGGDHIVQLVVSAQSNRPHAHGRGGIEGRVSWSIPLNLSRPSSGTFVHKLAARARIGEIQAWTKAHHRWRDQKAEVLALAIKYQLLSNFTSFIIVDDRKIRSKRVKRAAPVPAAVAHAQVDMFNAFMASQLHPGAPVNANGYAFQNVQPQPQQPAVVFGDEDDDDYSDDDSAEYGESAFFDQQAAALQQLHVQSQALTNSAVSFRGAPGGAPGGSARGAGGWSNAFSKPLASPRSSSSSAVDCFGGAAFGGGYAPLSAPAAVAPMRSRAQCTASPSSSSISALFDGSASPSLRKSGSAAPRDERDSRCKKECKEAPMLRRSSSPVSNEMCDFFAPPAPVAPAPSLDLLAFAHSQQQAQLNMDCFASFPSSPPMAAPSAASLSALTSSALAASTFFTVLVQMSCADGSWNLTSEFVTLVQQIASATQQPPTVLAAVQALSLASLTGLASSLGLPPKAIATLLACWTFSVCFSQRQSEWAMLVGKARGALRNTMKLPAEQFDQVTKQIIQGA